MTSTAAYFLLTKAWIYVTGHSLTSPITKRYTTALQMKVLELLLQGGVYPVTSLTLKRDDTKLQKSPESRDFAKLCGVVEDEQHSLFVCSAHHGIRLKFAERLRWNSVADLLNPKSEEELLVVGEYLKEIEKNMDVLQMCQ